MCNLSYRIMNNIKNYKSIKYIINYYTVIIIHKLVPTDSTHFRKSLIDIIELQTKLNGILVNIQKNLEQISMNYYRPARPDIQDSKEYTDERLNSDISKCNNGYVGSRIFLM